MIKKAYINLPVGQIHFRYIPAASGIPLVFLHRIPTSSQSYERVMARLAGTRPLYAFDTPGFGGSFDPEGSPTVETFADWFLLALDALDITAFHLCAQHTGTHFAIEMAIAEPGRVRSALLDGVMFSDEAERAALVARRGVPNDLDPDGAYIMKSWNYMKPYYTGADAALMHVEIISALRCLTSKSQAADAIHNQDVPARLPLVRCPLLITIAADDSLFSHMARIRAALPQIDTRVTPPAGIASPELDSDGFAERLRTLINSCEA